jgi:hypothetical protein
MNKDVVAGLGCAGGILAMALAAKLAQKAGMVDADTVTRMVVGANEIVIAWYGNLMPKAFVPNACARRVRRVGGWAMALSGLLYASLFLLAPLPVAFSVGSAAIVAGIAVTLGYALLLHRKADVS